MIFHTLFVFLMKTHLFMCYVENTPVHIFLKIHLFVFYVHNICMYIYIYTYIYIGTYILLEGSEYPSEIFWEIFWCKEICGKKNRDQADDADWARLKAALLQLVPLDA